MVLILDKNGLEIHENDYVMIGVRCNSMGDLGKVHIGRVTGKTGHGITIEDYPTRCKSPHYLTKVSERLAFLWNTNCLHEV